MSLSIPLGPVMADVAGLVLDESDRRRLAHPLVGGIILFARNFESPAQVKALTAEIRALRSPELIICVDHEGGRVQRFRQGFTAVPPMRRLGRLWDGDRADYRTSGGYARLRSVFEKVRAEREGAKARSTDTSNAIALDQHPNTMKAAPALFPPSPTGRCVADARPVCTRT